ncbi:hypothetical protein BC835DRAFT_570529 [Cytidiella melzeri]|nr:hypothetical protein BC835DRAFT_570529 [Cytidiella melzeri]
MHFDLALRPLLLLQHWELLRHSQAQHLSTISLLGERSKHQQALPLLVTIPHSNALLLGKRGQDQQTLPLPLAIPRRNASLLGKRSKDQQTLLLLSRRLVKKPLRTPPLPQRRNVRST